MRFIELSDVNDDILPCNEEDVDSANAYVLGLANKHRISENKLITPPKYIVKRIAICYACYIRAISLIGSDATAVFNGNSEGRDINAQKAKFYKQELEGLVNNLTASDFAEEVNGGVRINVFRA